VPIEKLKEYGVRGKKRKKKRKGKNKCEVGSKTLKFFHVKINTNNFIKSALIMG
jgi:hypothetical protein